MKKGYAVKLEEEQLTLEGLEASVEQVLRDKDTYYQAMKKMCIRDRRRAAKVVENAEFASLIRQGQLVDLREPVDFHRKHILGARNIPSTQLKGNLGALRKDKPVLLYENARGQRVMNACLLYTSRCV